MKFVNPARRYSSSGTKHEDIAAYVKKPAAKQPVVSPKKQPRSQLLKLCFREITSEVEATGSQTPALLEITRASK